MGPLSTYERNDIKPMAIVKPRPQSEVFEEELKPSLPPKKASIKKNRYKSAGVLQPQSGVAKKIAISKAAKNMATEAETNQEVNSQSDTDLCQHLSRKRNPFADSDDDSEEEDDFVDLSELPPLPQKSVSKPSLLPPKQKINKTRSEAQRIDKAILDKYRNQTPQKSTQFDEQDYEDVKIQEEDTCFDYDEPIPHSRILQELL